MRVVVWNFYLGAGSKASGMRINAPGFIVLSDQPVTTFKLLIATAVVVPAPGTAKLDNALGATVQIRTCIRPGPGPETRLLELCRSR